MGVPARPSPPSPQPPGPPGAMEGQGGDRQLLRHVLVAVFAMGSWVSVNALWVELPVVVKVLPEGWSLPAYLTVLVALGNVGPAAVALAQRLRPGALGERHLIGAILAVSAVAALLLALLWDRVALVAGQPRSVAYLALAFVLAAACCTSNVTFLPFLSRFPPAFVRTFFVGQGLSALVPCALALAQGVGQPECRNGTRPRQPHERFPATAFFWLLLALLAASTLAFAALAAPPPPRRGQRGDAKEEPAEEAFPLQEVAAAPAGDVPAAAAAASPRWRTPYLLALLAAASALANGVLPAVQSYACLPYGARAFHLAVVLGSVANPLACLAASLLLCRSAAALGAVAALGAALGAYLLALAALSPCPPLVGSSLGTALVVLAWTLVAGLFGYLRAAAGSLLHAAGRAALQRCGAAMQAGALLGALAIFPPVSVYHLFRSGRGCGDDCAA